MQTKFCVQCLLTRDVLGMLVPCKEKNSKEILKGPKVAAVQKLKFLNFNIRIVITNGLTIFFVNPLGVWKLHASRYLNKGGCQKYLTLVFKANMRDSIMSASLSYM